MFDSQNHLRPIWRSSEGQQEANDWRLWHGFRTLACLLCVMLSLTSCEQNAGESHFAAGTVTVIDGDSLRANGTEIRLWGIDAVELNQNCRHENAFWPCGKEAKSALESAVKWTALECQPKSIDRYDRVVAECFAGSQSLNAFIVSDGWALAYQRYTQKFLPQQEQAREHGKGIWTSLFIPPWDWRKGKRLEP